MNNSNQAFPYYSVLPQEILQAVYLPPESLGTKNYIENILKQTLPSGDKRNLKNDLSWQFLLDIHKVKQIKKRKPKKTFLTRQQRKDINLLKLPLEGWNYECLEVTRNMWREYMKRNLDFISTAPTCINQEWNNFSVIVAKSEMVGAELKIIRSKVPSLVGTSGTIVLETKMTFQIVTPESKLKTILKETSVFQFCLDKIKFIFFGKHLMTRPADRSIKRIKNIMRPDL